MKRTIALRALVLVLVLSSTACRGARIRDSADRIEKLENRVTALESKVEMLQRK